MTGPFNQRPGFQTAVNAPNFRTASWLRESGEGVYGSGRARGLGQGAAVDFGGDLSEGFVHRLEESALLLGGMAVHQIELGRSEESPSDQVADH